MRRTALLFVTCLAVAGPLGAQARSDQSRLSFGIGLGYNGGSDLWSVRGQPILGAFATDTANLGRIIRPTIGITFLGVYYPNPRWGLSGEIHLIGLAYEDNCVLTSSSGDTDNHRICSALAGKQSPGTAIAGTVGAAFRPFPWIGVQPYLRGNVGLVVSEQSAIRVNAVYRSAADSLIHDFPIYEDHNPTSISPTVGFALGVTGFISRSSQLRVEVKDNLVILKELTGGVVYLAREPPWQQRLHHIVTLNVGLEVVLEKRRGRRY